MGRQFATLLSRRSGAHQSCFSLFSSAIPSFGTVSLAALLLLCILASEQQQARADSDVDAWFNRELRSPKPKFIRFGRANRQKFIRLGRSPQEDYNGGENLEELIDAVDSLSPYPSARELRAAGGGGLVAQIAPADFMPVPKRAQKFIRFG